MRKKNWFVSLLASMLVLAILMFFILSVYNLIEIRRLGRKFEDFEKRFLSELDSPRMKMIEELLAPNSILSHYITAHEYFKKATVDLEKIFSELDDDPTTGYIRVFIVGNDPVWVTIRKGDTVIFSRDLKPGLSPYRFFYYKEPKVKTSYDITIPRDASLVVGVPNRVFLLVFGVGTSHHPTKIVQVTQSRIENIARDLNLYIPR